MAHLDDFSPTPMSASARRSFNHRQSRSVVGKERRGDQGPSDRADQGSNPHALGQGSEAGAVKVHYQWNARPGGAITSGDTAMQLQEVVPGGPPVVLWR